MIYSMSLITSLKANQRPKKSNKSEAMIYTLIVNYPSMKCILVAPKYLIIKEKLIVKNVMDLLINMEQIKFNARGVKVQVG